MKKDGVWPRKTSFPVKPVLLVDSTIMPTLPAPCLTDPAELTKNPLMYLLPKTKKATSHTQPCDCVIQSQGGCSHRDFVIPDVCLKNSLLTVSEVAVKPIGITTSENPNRSYNWSETMRDHQLSVPTPVRISKSWPVKVLEPVMAECGEPLRLKLFYRPRATFKL
jgi:hypothetical protein